MVSTNLPALFLASFTAFFFLILLIVVLLANTRNLLSRVFAVFLLCGTAWSLFAALAATSNTPAAEDYANISLNVLGLFPLVIAHFFFCLIYLKKEYKPWLYYTIPSYFILSYLMTTDHFTVVRDEPFTGGAGFHLRQQVGDLLPLAIVWGATFIGALLFYLIRDLFTSRDKIHLQKVKLLLVATVVGAAFTILFNSNPFFWAYPLDIIGELITAFILTYAILKFELVDVSTKLRNLIVEIIFSAILAALYLLMVLAMGAVIGSSFVWWPAVLGAVFLASLSRPLKDWLLKYIDARLYQTRYDYRETINKFAQTVGEILDLTILSSSVIKTIRETFSTSNVYLFVLKNDLYQLASAPNQAFLKPDNELISFLKINPQIVSRTDILAKIGVIPALNFLTFELVVPLTVGNSLVGLLLIDKRTSGDLYTSEDKNLLYTLGKASGIALKNSLLYEEVIQKNKDIARLLDHERDVNASKNEFISIASHYLRTPLTNVKGYLYLLINNKLTADERKTYLQRVFNEQKKLTTLIEDVISISSFERGVLKLVREKIKLEAIIKRVMEDFTSLAAEKNITLKSDIKVNLEIKVDVQKITQAVSNLVSNAIKFTNEGEVKIIAGLEDLEIKIIVKDSGIGIEEKQIPQLFQKFHRATDLKTYNYEGSGLGLYITKLIVEAHGGHVAVESKAGIGSSFSISLPLQANQSEISPH